MLSSQTPRLIRNTFSHLKTQTSSYATKKRIPFHIHGNGLGVSQSIRVEGSPHTITVDAYPSFGGKDSAPSPLAYNLGSLSSCTQVTGSLVARNMGLQLGEWSVKVSATLDPAVLVEGSQEGDGNWDNVKLQVKVQTDTRDSAVFERFADETERRCPITQLFKRSGLKWESEWVNEDIGLRK